MLFELNEAKKNEREQIKKGKQSKRVSYEYLFKDVLFLSDFNSQHRSMVLA